MASYSDFSRIIASSSRKEGCWNKAVDRHLENNFFESNLMQWK